jgi:hypothetical protein
VKSDLKLQTSHSKLPLRTSQNPWPPVFEEVPTFSEISSTNISRLFNFTYMKAVFLFFLPFLMLPFWSVAQGSRSSTPDYVQYEREDVTPYRKTFKFEMPETPVQSIPVEVPAYQSLEKQYFANGQKVHIEADTRLITFINKHIELNGREKTREGFRIQIFAGRSREGAQRAKSRFLQSFPGMSSYLRHMPPTYRVRVGDFLDRMDAQRAVRELKSVFPDAFVVPDEINLPRFQTPANSDG